MVITWGMPLRSRLSWRLVLVESKYCCRLSIFLCRLSNIYLFIYFNNFTLYLGILYSRVGKVNAVIRLSVEWRGSTPRCVSLLKRRNVSNGFNFHPSLNENRTYNHRVYALCHCNSKHFLYTKHYSKSLILIKKLMKHQNELVCKVFIIMWVALAAGRCAAQCQVWTYSCTADHQMAWYSFKYLPNI